MIWQFAQWADEYAQLLEQVSAALRTDGVDAGGRGGAEQALEERRARLAADRE